MKYFKNLLCRNYKTRLFFVATTIILVFVLYSILIPKPVDWEVNNPHHSAVLRQYRSLLNVQTFGNKVPKIVHYIYKSEKIPGQFFKLIQKCILVNADLRFILWTDEIGDQFIRRTYPEDRYRVFKSYSSGLEKADLLRLFIMHYFGGVYMDMDVECRKPLTSLPDTTTCLMDQEIPLQTQVLWSLPMLIMNSVMICHPKHRFFELAINRIVTDYKELTVYKTGPLYLQKVYDDYLAEQEVKKLPLDMDKPNYRLFSPLIDPALFPHCKKYFVSSIVTKDSFNKSACLMAENLYTKFTEEELIKESLCIHRFLHFGSKSAWLILFNRVNLLEKDLNITILTLN